MTDTTFKKLKFALQTFQSERISSTYTDLRQDPEYTMIGDFFFTKLYAPQDFTFRDTSIKKLHATLDGKLYKGMIKGVTQVIELHELTDELDDLMVHQMMAFNVDETLTMADYKKVYKSLDNYDQRLHQIHLGAQVTRTFHGLSKKWVVGISLKTVKTAAAVLNIKPIIDFIYEGYTSFKQIDHIDYFIDTVLEREIAWHNTIWES